MYDRILKMGGSFHPNLNICRKAIAKQYREGNVKRTYGVVGERAHEMVSEGNVDYV